MIALPDALPLVEFDNGRVVSFQRDWLVRSLVQAAHKAGYPQWWLAEHVAESVTTYLTLRFNENVMPIPRLASAVQSILQVIGYAEVASHFAPGPPPMKLSLLELAREAGSGYELAFFEILGRAIQELLAASATHIEFFALDRAIRHLRSRKLWSRDCDALRAEIVAFVREQVGAAQQEIVVSVVQ